MAKRASAKKSAKAATNSPRKRASGAPPSSGSGFKTLAMHITEESGRRSFDALKAERPSSSAFSLTATQPQNLDPESAAKRILEHALASETMPSLTAPKVDGDESTFKSLGVETVPLTGTTVVKFRQQVKGIPVYGSLISVELDDNNDMVSLNSNIAKPNLPSYVAKMSPQDALKKVAAEAGYGRQLPDSTPTLNLFHDPKKGKWHLAYVVEDVRSRQKSKSEDRNSPLVYDYVVDALSGSLVAELPRTPTATESAPDEHGEVQTFGVDMVGNSKVMRDPTLNIETYDFRFADPQGGRPAGQTRRLAIHAGRGQRPRQCGRVATFLRETLKRNNIDNSGGRMVSSVNCVLKRDEDPPGSKIWLNAFWDGNANQMIYGQATFNDRLQSLSASLSVVAHELFHGVTGATSRLVYQGETGALNESYSDIFGILSRISTSRTSASGIS